MLNNLKPLDKAAIRLLVNVLTSAEWSALPVIFLPQEQSKREFTHLPLPSHIWSQCRGMSTCPWRKKPTNSPFKVDGIRQLVQASCIMGLLGHLKQFCETLFFSHCECLSASAKDSFTMGIPSELNLLITITYFLYHSYHFICVYDNLQMIHQQKKNCTLF